MEKLLDYIQDFWNEKRISKTTCYIGTGDEGMYNTICKYIAEQADEDKEGTCLIENECEFRPDLNMMTEIKRDLPKAQMGYLTSHDLIMYADEQANVNFLQAINRVFSKHQHEFTTRQKQENYYLTQIVIWVHYMLSKPNVMRVIYYNYKGTVNERDIWFLELAEMYGLQVLILDPMGIQKTWQSWETDIQSHGNRPVLFRDRVRQGKAMRIMKTGTARYAKQLEDELFDGTGVFKAWMFRDGTTKPVILNGVLEDVLVSLREENRMREGFKANNTTKEVTTPIFYMEIDGVSERGDYEKLKRVCQQAKPNYWARSLDDLQRTVLKKEEMVQLVYKMKPNGDFEYETLKEVSYSCLSKMTKQAGMFLIRKLNEYLRERNANRNDRVLTANLILNLPLELVRMIENYDFPFMAPKLYYFCELESKISKKTGIIIDYLSAIGFDILIFTPCGVSGFESDNLTHIRLDKIVYDERLRIPSQGEAKTETGKGLKALINGVMKRVG